MRPLAVPLFLTLLIVAFAGCGEDPERFPDGVPTPSPSPSQSATATSSSGVSSSESTSGSSSTTTTSTGAENGKPTASITAAINGTNATFALAGSDPDGDTLVWELDFGDGNATNGTALPAEATHTYVASNYTVAFMVTDGAATNTSTLDISIVGAGASGTVFTGAQEFPSNPASSATVPTPLGNIFLGAAACIGFYAGMSGQDCVFFALEAAFEGQAFTITSDVGDPDYEFWPACDPSDPMNPAFAGSTADGPEAGTVPEGAGCVVIWAKLPPDTPTHTFTVG